MTTNRLFSVYWLSEIEMPLANKFYRTHNFRGKPRRHDPCAIVRSSQQHIIACGYLKKLEACQLLSGIAVAPEYQDQGVARQLLTAMAEVFDAQTFTFPYQNLVPLYRSIGFSDVSVTEQPEAIVKLFQAYREQGREIVLMSYQNKHLL